ncbi:MAG: acetylxylan esterase [Kiritimatiellae bacterium]|nr:acetylxylan esterase [Kiritimatiellia bacterium]
MRRLAYLCVLLLAGSAMSESAIPDLLTCADGTTVKTKEQWESKRRPEILELFRSQCFGRNLVERPDSLKFTPAAPDTDAVGGKAIRKLVNITYEGPGGKGKVLVRAFIPKSSKPVPGFVLICNRDPVENINIEPRPEQTFWPVYRIVERGYAAIAFYNGDVAPDKYNGFTNGLYRVFQPDPKQRNAESGGAINAWAWGASRVMDWIETEPLLDAKHIGVVGHSRGGKTALWCGAQDQRFAMACSNDSGCSGAKLNRGSDPKSEHIAQITKSFRHWFCRNYDKYANNEDALPFDQHELLALIAPRICCVGSASLDSWAGPRNELKSCVLASTIWKLYGLDGISGTEFPQPDHAISGGRVNYHLRKGKHNLELFDWDVYMDVADRFWRNAK